MEDDRKVVPLEALRHALGEKTDKERITDLERRVFDLEIELANALTAIRMLVTREL